MSVYEYQPLLIFCVAVAAAFGAVMGSFLNCAGWRITHGESFLKGRSHCPSCGHNLGVMELIPVLSWLILGGKCRWCKEKISVRYPLTELGCSLLTVLCLLRFDLTAVCLRNYIFLCCLFLLTITDLEDMTIPDGCHIAAVLAWFAFLPFLFTGWKDVALSVLAAFVYGGGLLAVSLVMDKMLGRESLGGGDIKLFAVIGLYLGMAGTLFALMFSCLAGLVFHGLQGRKGEGKAFPFGPWIALGAAVMLLFGEPLVNWYLGFF